MTPVTFTYRRSVLHGMFAVVVFCAGSVCGHWYARAAVATPAKPAAKAPAKETLKYGDNEVVVERSQKATSDDLKLPFYRGAKVTQSYTYRVSKKDGTLLSYYAVAQLTSRDTPEQVAKVYTAQLPGKPKPESVKDKSGARLVLAVSSKSEVRSVTITKGKTGSNIRLTRAIKHKEALSLPKPELVPPGSGRERRGPGPRMRQRQRQHRGGMEA